MYECVAYVHLTIKSNMQWTKNHRTNSGRRRRVNNKCNVQIEIDFSRFYDFHLRQKSIFQFFGRLPLSYDDIPLVGPEIHFQFLISLRDSSIYFEKKIIRNSSCLCWTDVLKLPSSYSVKSPSHEKFDDCFQELEILIFNKGIYVNVSGPFFIIKTVIYIPWTFSQTPYT